MSNPLYITDSYARECRCRVVGQTPEGGLILAHSIFYPTGGGQPGDSGLLHWQGGPTAISTTVKGQAGEIILLAAEPRVLPPVGAEVLQDLDWERRYRIMQMHTVLHLLSVIVPFPVIGGAIGSDSGRLDFDMSGSPAKKAVLQDQINELITRDLPVSARWINNQEMAASPQLIRTMSVKPPVRNDRVRLVQIGYSPNVIDLQPCDGTHVARTGEIAPVELAKIEKKGQQSWRITVQFCA